jgi:RimJ/RimL family protein N-acetyltransferase
MIISGNNGVSLRLVDLDDAQFILDLRSDSKLKTHLSISTETIEAQRDFIIQYKKKENDGMEYYFIIENNSNAVGCVRIYDIDKDAKTFTWGSWIVQHNNPGHVALSSAYLSYYFAFNYLLLDTALFDVRNKNTSVKKLYKLYADIIYEDNMNCYFSFAKSNFHRFKDKFGSRLPSVINISK